MFAKPVLARVSGNSQMEVQPSSGGGKQRGSSVAQPSRSTDAILPFQYAKTGERFCMLWTPMARTHELWPDRSMCKVIQHGDPTDNRLSLPREIAAIHTFRACRSMVALLR